MTLRQRIEKLLETGVTARELAARVGVSPATVSNIVLGLTPRHDTLVKFARYFRVNPGELLDDAMPQKSKSYPDAHRLDRLSVVAEGLDEEGERTLLMCAELLREGTPEIRRSLRTQFQVLLDAIHGGKKHRAAP
ncbi:helix-turn-helix domain-containing protein [Candidatus Nitrospira bockiana]